MTRTSKSKPSKTNKQTKPQRTKPAASAAGELDDAQLEEVAGGFNPQPEPPRTALTDRIRTTKGRLIGR